MAIPPLIPKEKSNMAAPASTAVAAPSAVSTVKQLLISDRFKKDLASALPKHCNPDRQLRVMLTTLNKNPKLAECSQESLFACLLSCSQYGLEPDGRAAHLIPFWNTKKNIYECTLIIDYKGIAELVMRSGVVSYIHADIICENDDFSYNKGQVEKHVIDWRKPRGKPYAVYALVRFKDGTEKSDVMSIEDVDAIRKRSKSSDKGPWVTDYNEMAKKTVFKRLSKWVPISAEIRDAVDTDIDETISAAIEDKFATMKAVGPGKQEALAAPKEEPAGNVIQLPPGEQQQQQPPGEGKPAEGGEPAAEGLTEEQLEAQAKAEQEAAAKKKADAEAAAKAEEKAPEKPKVKIPPWDSATHKPQLMEKLKAANLTQAQLCGYLKSAYMVDGCMTIDDVEQSAPTRLAQVLAKFETVAPKIAEQPGKSAQ